MTTEPLATPVAFAFFNRPDRAAMTFERIAAVKPRQLFLIADGPRPNHATDAEMCAAARAVVERINWECEVHRNYAEENMGVRRRLSSGFDWVFDHVDRAIIIEDDVLAEPTFFYFAQEMLERYQDDERIMHISGYNAVGWYYPEASTQRLRATYPYSYFFTAFGPIWGWATWRRAWKTYYDVDMKLWTPELEAELVKHPRISKSKVATYAAILQGADTWDYQWGVACLLQSGLFVVPAQNLIRNIGYGTSATNTTDTQTRHAMVTSEPMDFPLIHPPWMMIWPTYERAAYRVYNGDALRSWLLRNLPTPWFNRVRTIWRRLEKLRR